MDFQNKIGQEQALRQLEAAGTTFITLFEAGKLSVEVYRPHMVDKQQPHDRDEFYLVIAGTGKFRLLEKETDFKPGDFLYVPAHAPHQFIEFTDDFVTWVFFIG